MSASRTAWSVKQFAAATHVTPTAASRKAAAFSARLRRIVEASLALQPSLRACDLAAQLVAVMIAGGRLAGYDEPTLRQFVLELCRQESGSAACSGESD